MTQLFRSSLCLTIDSRLINKVGEAVVALVAEHQMPAYAIEFLQFPDKLNILHNILLKLGKNLQVDRLKPEEKLSLEMKMREDL